MRAGFLPRISDSPPTGAEASPAPAFPAAEVEGREAQLLAIARGLFAKKGFDGTSLRDIAEAAQITKAALYYYFPSKDALFQRVVIESMDLLLTDVTAAVQRAPTPTAKVRAFMYASAKNLESAPDRWVAASNSFWQVGFTELRSIAVVKRDAFEHLLRRCIKDGIAAGELRAVDPVMAARLLLSGVNQMVRWHRPEGDLTTREVIDQYLDIVLLGLLNRGAPTPDRLSLSPVLFGRAKH